MKLIRFAWGDESPRLGVACGKGVHDLTGLIPYGTIGELLTAEASPAELVRGIRAAIQNRPPDFEVQGLLEEGREVAGGREVRLLAPVDEQEVWASGVTYKRSEEARMAESKGAAQFYALVYDADRPELFLKATPGRSVGPGDPVGIRRDAKWSVPEPELAVVLNARMEVLGYTIGNDMSSRDIEGENPLYLPQAKVYNNACAVGPAIALDIGDPHDLGIRLRILRGGEAVFSGETHTSKMKRRVGELVEYLGRAYDFPHGAVLLTGTGIVPDDAFTLQEDDVVEIDIDGIGTLRNPVKWVGRPA